MYDEKIAELGMRVGRVEQRVEKVEDAFPPDAHGKPKYHECRQYLTRELREDELISEIKDGAIKQIVYWSLGILLGLVGLYFKLRS